MQMERGPEHLMSNGTRRRAEWPLFFLVFFFLPKVRPQEKRVRQCRGWGRSGVEVGQRNFQVTSRPHRVDKVRYAGVGPVSRTPPWMWRAASTVKSLTTCSCTRRNHTCKDREVNSSIKHFSPSVARNQGINQRPRKAPYLLNITSQGKEEGKQK